MWKERGGGSQNKSKSSIFLTSDLPEHSLNYYLTRHLLFHRYLSEFNNHQKFQKGTDSSELPKWFGIIDKSVTLSATTNNYFCIKLLTGQPTACPHPPSLCKEIGLECAFHNGGHCLAMGKQMTRSFKKHEKLTSPHIALVNFLNFLLLKSLAESSNKEYMSGSRNLRK